MAFDFSDNVQKMFTALTSASSMRSNVANTLLSSGISAMQNKKYAQAASAFRQAAALQPDLTAAYTYQGDAYSRMGKRKEAIEAYKMSLKVDKTQDTVYTTLAGVYIDNGQKTEAEKVLKDGIKQNKLNTMAYYMLGQLQAQRDDFSAAEANFREVIKLEPKDGNGYYGLGMALNGQEKYEEAVVQLTKATELKRDFVPALLELGRAYNGLNDMDKAQEVLKTLKGINTYDASVSATELAAEIRRPKMLYFNSSSSTLDLDYYKAQVIDTRLVNVTTTLLREAPFTDATHTDYLTPGASRDLTVKFVFDSDMDVGTVMNPTNWRITKASGGTEGLYNGGLYNNNLVSIPPFPKAVSYDPERREATLTVSIRQLAGSTDGIIDPQHLIFSFQGKDVSGKSMDTSADQYAGWKGGVF